MKPDQYTAGTVLGRYMNGLGFRYRWATEGLSNQDMDYRICESGRSIKETLAHILNIVTMVECAFTGETYEMPEKEVTLGLAELRRATLDRIERISDQLKGSTASDNCPGRAIADNQDRTVVVQLERHWQSALISFP